VDGDKQVARRRAETAQQFQRALSLDDDDARTLYESIIELNREFEWLEDLVDHARQKLKQLPDDSNVEKGE